MHDGRPWERGYRRRPNSGRLPAVLSVCVCPPQESNLLTPLLPHNPATILSLPTFFQNEDFVTYLRPHFSFMIVGFANDESPG